MKYTFALFLILFTLLLVAVVYISFTIHRIHDEFKKPQKNRLMYNNSNWLVRNVVIGLAFFIILAIAAPYFLTTSFFVEIFKDYGSVGDAIGGLMNPFIGIAGVLVTGLAFYMQYEANDLQRKQFNEQIEYQESQTRIQQFESQFYEMLRLQRENVSEMKITGYDFESTEFNSQFKVVKSEKIIEGRKIFVTMVTELEAIVEIFKDNAPLDRYTFQQAYGVFFSGMELFSVLQSPEQVKIQDLIMARKRHQPSTKDVFAYDPTLDRKKFKNAKLNFNYKPFSGHSSRLGHYFRHLYLTVKLVVNAEVFSGTPTEIYLTKMKYLKILRAQLSDHEQILLFYNWLGGPGGAWEDLKNSFFTEYCVIQNMRTSELMKDDFIRNEVTHLNEKQVLYRKGKLFEAD